MRRIIVQTPGKQTGKRDGAVVPSMAKMPHPAGKGGTYHMMMASPYTSYTGINNITKSIISAEQLSRRRRNVSTVYRIDL